MKLKKRKINIKKRRYHFKPHFTLGVFLLVSFILGAVIWLSANGEQVINAQPKESFQKQLPEKSEIRSVKRIVFLGDSITEHQDWSVLLGISNVFNAGISGNTTDDILERLHGVTSLNPDRLFIMAGINDFFHGKSAEYVFANYEKIISEVKEKSPSTLIYIQSTLPINNDLSRIGKVDAQKIVDLNEKLKTLSDSQKVFFIDLYSYFCGIDHKLYGKYAKDGVHPVPEGYAVWRELLKPYITQSE